MRRNRLRFSVLAVLTILLSASASAEVKQVAYPRVAVEVSEAYQPDAAFNAMRKAFADATSREDASALFALVAPSFVWTVNGAVAADFDPGRDTVHNFKVLFGFRQYGRDVDGDVENGPFWAALAAFASDDTFYLTGDGGNLVCSPIAATIADDRVFQEARGKIEAEGEAADWYFVLRDNTPVMRAPDDKGTPVGRLGREAVPVLRVHPPAPEGQPASTPTHLEVLLPTGKSGWIAVAAVLPLDTSRLCYAKTPAGAWKIAIYDASE
jgi:hypothetical protein